MTGESNWRNGSNNSSLKRFNTEKSGQGCERYRIQNLRIPYMQGENKMGLATKLFHRAVETRDRLRPDIEPEYLGEVPAWRFEQLLADSDTVDVGGTSSVPSPGHTSKLDRYENPDTPEAAVKQFQKHVPDDAVVEVYAAGADDRLSYRSRVSYRNQGDDPFNFTIDTWSYRGELCTGEYDTYLDRLLVPPGRYGIVDEVSLLPSRDDERLPDGGRPGARDVTDTVEQVLAAQSGPVYGRIPDTLFTGKNGDIDFHAWDTGEDAARYWRQYVADDIHVLDATATIDEKQDFLRHTVRVDGVPTHQYRGQDEGPTAGFRSFYDREEEPPSLEDVLDA